MLELMKQNAKNVIVVHPRFEGSWPFVADYLAKHWQAAETQLIRLDKYEERSIEQLIPHPETVERLISLMATVSLEGVKVLDKLKEAVIYTDPYGKQASEECLSVLKENKVKLYKHDSEGYWGQSVAEFALGLTLSALRQIPQGYKSMMTSLKPWDYDPEDGMGQAGKRGVQFCDSTDFTSGTLEGKRVRIVGAGNIASRFASFAHFMGADVAAWDPYAPEASFHRSGSRRVRYLEQLLDDAEIFLPMLPLIETTRGLIKAEHIKRLPKGCLVVLVTRALITDFATIKERVLKDELSLAADVFDVEPVPLDDPLLGRQNVIHTPHMAGRTKEANYRYAEMLLAFFQP